MKIGIFFCSLALVGGVWAGDAVVSGTSGTPFTVMSYNTRFHVDSDGPENTWAKRVPRIARVVRDAHVDLIGFQEITDKACAGFVRTFPEFAFADGPDACSGNPIAYRPERFERLASGAFFMSERPDDPTCNSWGSSGPRQCRWARLKDRTDGRTLRVYCMHPDWRSGEQRAKGMEMVLKRANAAQVAGDSVIVLGDMNDDEGRDLPWSPSDSRFPTGMSIRIAKGAMNDTYDVSETPPVGTAETVHGFSTNYSARIDRIFVSRDFRVLAHRTHNDRPGGGYPSDHDPISATVRAGCGAAQRTPIDILTPTNRAPITKSTKWWFDRFETHKKMIACADGKYDLVFIGDSITHNWENPGHGVFDGLKKRYSVLNLGYCSDRIEHMLWRLENGELDGYKARGVMVMAGTNNWKDGPDVVEAGVRRILGLVRAKQPQAKILLCAILPNGTSAADPRRVANMKVNPRLKKLAAEMGAEWIDFGEQFLNADGSVHSMLKDNLHPDWKGYQIWLKAVTPVFERWLGGDHFAQKDRQYLWPAGNFSTAYVQTADGKIDPVLKFDDQTCPMCLCQGAEDPVSSLCSTLLFTELHKRGIPAQLYVPVKRGHGVYGFDTAVDFMRRLGYLDRMAGTPPFGGGRGVRP